MMKNSIDSENMEHPYEEANFICRIFICWMVPYFKKGWKRTLNAADIPRLPVRIESLRLYERLNKNYVGYTNNKNKPFHLVLAIWKTFRAEATISYTILCVEELVIRVMQPVCLGFLLRYLSDQKKYTTGDGLLFLAGFCFFALLSPLFHHPNYFELMALGLKIRTALSSLIFRKAVKLSSKSLGEVSVGHIVNHLSNDLQRFDEVVMFLPYIVVAPAQLIIVGFILFNEVGSVSLFGLLLLVMYVPLQSLMARIYASLRIRINSITDERSALMNEIIAGIKVLKMYAWEYAFSSVISSVRKRECSLLKQMNIYRALNNGMFLICTKLVMLITMSIYVSREKSSITSEKIFVTLTMFYIVRLSVALFFQFAISFCSEIWSSMKRINKFLTLDEVDPALLPSQKPVIEKSRVSLQNVSASWNNNSSPVIENINFDIEAGELLFIVGEVGSGKSSLLMSILGELIPQKGDITIHGNLTYVPQDPWIFSGSVKENILFGLPFEVEKYKNVISACALETDLDQFPFRDESLVGEKGVLLSGGQRARICLARALYFDADIYIFDDPFSAVDPKVGHQIFERCIKNYLSDKIRILVTHQLQFLKTASKILVLKEGKVLSYGSSEDLKVNDFNFIDKKSNDLVSVKKNDIIDIHQSISSLDSAFDPLMNVVELTVVNNEDIQIVEESRKSGAVSWSVYIKFLLSGGGIFFIGLLIITNISAYALSILGDWWLSVWIDGSVKKSDNSTVASPSVNAFSYGNYSINYYYQVYLALSLLGIFFMLGSAIINYMLCVLSSRNLHDQMFSHFLHSPVSFFDNNPIGRVLNRFTKDVGQIDDAMGRIFHDVVSLSLLSLSIVIMVAVINYIVIFPTIGLLFLFLWLRKFYLSSLRDIKRLEATSKSPVFSHVSAAITGLPVIRSFNRCDQFIDEFDAFQDKNASIWFMFIGSTRWFGIMLDGLSTIFIILTALFCFFMSDSISSGQVGFALSQAIQMSGMFQWVVRQSAELESQMTSVERVLEYGELPSEAPKKNCVDQKVPVNWPYSGKIEFRNLSLRYESSSQYVLKEMSFVIDACEKIGIVGRTGAGKSSLISSLFRLTEPEGLILIDNIVVNDIGLHTLRKKISIIPQNPVLFTKTLRYNLDPFSEFADDQLWEALEQVCLKHYVSSITVGLSVMMTEGGSNFSLGQRQLVCLARCLLRRNKILILDEATANIDQSTDALIQKTIRTQFKDCTILTIAHRLNTVIDSDRIMVLDCGKIVEFDKPDILMENSSSIFSSLLKEVDLNVNKELINHKKDI